MIQKKYGAVLIIFCICGMLSRPALAARFKVLVVMSYDEAYPWVQDIRKGIESVLAETCEIEYFYMNTRNNFKGGEEKAEEAYVLYQEFQPDGVIAADDNAQSMFVVPYLKDKVKTPVMFCGVNAKAEKYGYPASNVSGILERIHFKESIALAQQLVPSIKTVGYLTGDCSSARAAKEYVEKEQHKFSAKSVDFKMVNTLKEAVSAAEELREKCDLLFITVLNGLPDDNGRPLESKEIIPIIAETFGKATITESDYRVKYGILCAVMNTGIEQGIVAGRMLNEAMNGMPVSLLPITRNIQVRAVINETVMKKLGIEPACIIMNSSEFVKTER